MTVVGGVTKTKDGAAAFRVEEEPHDGNHEKAEPDGEEFVRELTLAR